MDGLRLRLDFVDYVLIFLSFATVLGVHYYWVGAIPAMVFLGIVMMPFYYGSKVRSVPEFMLGGSARAHTW